MKDQESTFAFEGVPTPPPRHAKGFRRAGRWCLFAIVAITPFFFMPAAFVAVGMLALAGFICFLGCALEERKIEYPSSLLAITLLLFVAAQGLSARFSISPSQSFWGGLTAPDSVASFIIYLLIFLLFSAFFRRDDLKKLAATGGVGLLIAVGIVFFKNSDPLGSVSAWAVILGTVIAGLSVVRPGSFTGRAKLAFFAIAFATLVGLVLINDRSLWLAIAIFVVIVAALRFEPREHFQYAFVIIVISLFFALVGSRMPSFFQISKDLRPGVSATLATTQGVLKGPAILIGSGPATFAFDFDTFKPVSINTTSFWSDSFEQGHDFVATLLATGGLLSLLLLLVTIFLAIQPFLRIHTLDTDVAMVAAGIAFILASLFLYPASFAEFIILFALLGISASGRSHIQIPFATLLLVLVLAAITLAGAFFLGEQYTASIFLAQSNQLAAAGNLSQAYVKVNAAFNLDHSDEDLRAASQILLSEARTLAVSTDPNATAELPAAVANAVQAAQGAVNINQHDPANWGNLGAVYEAVMPIATGADSLAVGSYQSAANLDPVNPQWDVDIARTLMESVSLLPTTSATASTTQMNRATAEAILEKAISLKDDYADPRVLLVQLYLQEGNIAQAIQKVQELQQQNPLDPGVAFEIGYLYYESNEMSQAQQEFQVATILDPNYANARYFLGLIYDQEGMETQALGEFQKILVLNPGNPQVAQIIANLEAGRPALANDVSSPTLSGQPAAIPLPNVKSTPTKAAPKK